MQLQQLHACRLNDWLHFCCCFGFRDVDSLHQNVIIIYNENSTAWFQTTSLYFIIRIRDVVQFMYSYAQQSKITETAEERKLTQKNRPKQTKRSGMRGKKTGTELCRRKKALKKKDLDIFRKNERRYYIPETRLHYQTHKSKAFREQE